LSLGWLPSIRLSAMAGCQAGIALKSRIAAQTRSAGASITLEI
jgi:hypothetical protein